MKKIVFLFLTFFISCALFSQEYKRIDLKFNEITNITKGEIDISADSVVAKTSFLLETKPIFCDFKNGFTGIAPLCDMFSTQKDSFFVYVSVSKDSSEWSAWERIISDKIAKKHHFVGLLTTEEGFHFVKFLWNAELLPENQVVIKNFSVDFFYSGKSSPQMIQQREEVKKRLDEIKKNASNQKSVPCPPFLTREMWNCPEAFPTNYTPTQTQVSHIIIHHTETRNSASDWMQEVRTIWQFHVYTNGWSDIGYNFLIDPEGVIYEGRDRTSQFVDVVGAHALTANYHSMGISFLGNYVSIIPTNDALSSSYELLGWKCFQRNIDPEGKSTLTGNSVTHTNLNHIAGHRNINNTECPGEALYNFLPEIRTKTYNLINGIPNEVEQFRNLEIEILPLRDSNGFSLSVLNVKNLEINIRIFDISGRILISKSFSKSVENQSFTNFSKGIFFIEISTLKQKIVKKWVNF